MTLAGRKRWDRTIYLSSFRDCRRAPVTAIYKLYRVMQPRVVPTSGQDGNKGMKPMNRSILASSVAACICLSLSAPLLAAGPTITAKATPPSSGPAPAITNGNEKLRAAAEPFEKLTEISFEATLPTIDQTIGEAEAAAREVRTLLSVDAASQLDAQIAGMNSARQKQDHAGLALASIEAYRVLVSAVTSNAKVPTEVSVLDYAGFRFDADLKAKPVRWSDMARAVSFARENWDELLPRAKSSPIAKDFDTALANMDQAVTQRSEGLAASSVKTELDLVDQLEKFFSSR